MSPAPGRQDEDNGAPSRGLLQGRTRWHQGRRYHRQLHSIATRSFPSQKQASPRTDFVLEYKLREAEARQNFAPLFS